MRSKMSYFSEKATTPPAARGRWRKGGCHLAPFLPPDYKQCFSVLREIEKKAWGRVDFNKEFLYLVGKGNYARREIPRGECKKLFRFYLNARLVIEKNMKRGLPAREAVKIVLKNAKLWGETPTSYDEQVRQFEKLLKSMEGET